MPLRYSTELHPQFLEWGKRAPKKGAILKTPNNFNCLFLPQSSVPGQEIRRCEKASDPSGTDSQTDKPANQDWERQRERSASLPGPHGMEVDG